MIAAKFARSAARASAVERDARRLVAAWRTQRQYRYALADALQGLLDEPYGCPLCDAGRVLNPAKGHWPECPYEIARVVLAELLAVGGRGSYEGELCISSKSTPVE